MIGLDINNSHPRMMTHHLSTMEDITEDQEALEVIDRLEERINIEEIEVDGSKRTFIHNGYGSRRLYKIEEFVKEIEKGRKGGFVEVVARYSGIKRIDPLFFGKNYYDQLNDWLKRYSDLSRYSARVEVFYDVCKELGLIRQDHFIFGEPGELARDDGVRYMDVFNMIIDRVRVRCQSREFKEHERLRRHGAKKNVRSVLALEKAMFDKETGKSRWLIISLTLQYQGKYRRWITPAIIQKHRNRFFGARRYNRLMSGIKGYVWGIEQGEDTGLHMHVILFYSAEHNHDEHIAMQIGEYWKNVVTEGKGHYWNSNQERLKKGYKRKRGVGVGQINWDETPKRQALRTNLVYPAKATQYLMIKGGKSMHTFGWSKVPKKGKMGRPRNAASTNEKSNDSSVNVLLNEIDANATKPGTDRKD